MSPITRRARRWLQRTLWMIRAVIADFGLPTEARGRRESPPLWRRDNPFLQRTVRSEARRLTIYWRMFWLIAVMGGVLLGVLYLIDRFPIPLQSFSHSMLGLPSIGLAAMALPLLHIAAVMSVRNLVSPSLVLEARRQTLDGLIASPMRPAEMLLAMTTGPASVAMLVSLAGLPIYFLVAQMGGMSGADIVSIYLVLVLLAFTPPSYTLPALAGGAASATPEQAEAIRKAQQARSDRPRPFAPSSLMLFWFFYLGLVWSHMPGGGALLHLLAPLSIPQGAAQMLMAFTWPYTLVQALIAPLPFYQATLPPLLYILPLALLGKVSSMLATASALTSSNTPEILRSPIFQRHRALALWLRRVSWLCMIGYAWRLCVKSGDAAAVLGHAAGGGWDEAGLLTIFCGATLLAVYGRTISMITMSRRSHRLLPTRLMIRRVLRKTLRPLRAALILYIVACLLGGSWPFPAAAFQTLGQIALATVSIVVFGVGARLLFSVWIIRRKAPTLLQWLLVLGMPFFPLSALWLPGNAVHLAAASPLGAWLHLFPNTLPWLRAAAASPFNAPRWPFETQISFSECVAASTAAGALCIWLGYALQNTRAATRHSDAVRAASVSAPVKVKTTPSARVQYKEKTDALMAWASQHFDNPLFIRALRAQTRSGAWFQSITVTAVFFLALQAATIAYPDLVGFAASGFAWVHFFETPNFYGSYAVLSAYVALAGAALTVHTIISMMRLAPLTEAMLQRDQQGGVLGAILLTPLKSRQIFWGLLWGQSALPMMQWGIWGAVLLILNLEAALTVGAAPALAAWVVGQIFTAALLAISGAMGAAMATRLIKSPGWKGVSFLLTTLLLGGIIYLEVDVFGEEFQRFNPLWAQMSLYYLAGSAAALPFAILACVYGRWSLQRLRDRDIAFGDSIPR